MSYRTDDSVYATSAISNELTAHLGRVNVFRDRDSLIPGDLYPERIRNAVARCAVVLAVIGPHWLNAKDIRGNRRIDSPADWVRTELRTAFALGIPVVPLLLDGTALPTQDQLPADIARLSVSTFWHVRERTLAEDVRGLLDRIAPGTVHRQAPTSGSTQNNNAGTVYAVQGGNQTINISEPTGNLR